jgi:hypothetical protein
VVLLFDPVTLCALTPGARPVLGLANVPAPDGSVAVLLKGRINFGKVEAADSDPAPGLGKKTEKGVWLPTGIGFAESDPIDAVEDPAELGPCFAGLTPRAANPLTTSSTLGAANCTAGPAGGAAGGSVKATAGATTCATVISVVAGCAETLNRSALTPIALAEFACADAGLAAADAGLVAKDKFKIGFEPNPELPSPRWALAVRTAPALANKIGESAEDASWLSACNCALPLSETAAEPLGPPVSAGSAGCVPTVIAPGARFAALA